MAMSDNILFVKETKTCSYVLVINTPRLCGVPGFKSRRDAGEQHLIRCREIVESPQSQRDLDVPDDDYPHKIARSKPILPPPATEKVYDATKETIASFLRTFQSMFVGDKSDLPTFHELGTTEDGDIIFEFMADADDMQIIKAPRADAEDDTGAAERFAKALKAAGFEVSTDISKAPTSKDREDASGVTREKKSKDEATDDGSSPGSPGEQWLKDGIPAHQEL